MAPGIVDDKNLDWALARFELETQLIPDRGEDVGTRGAGVVGYFELSSCIIGICGHSFASWWAPYLSSGRIGRQGGLWRSQTMFL